jgi:hypothetical protein
VLKNAARLSHWKLEKTPLPGMGWFLHWLISSSRLVRGQHKAMQARNPPCSFCGRHYRDLSGLLIAGERGGLICDECIDRCRVAMDDEKRRREDLRNANESAAE